MSQVVARVAVRPVGSASRSRAQWRARTGILAVSAMVLAYCLLPFIWMFVVSIAEEHSQFVRELEYIPSHPTIQNYIEVFQVMPFARFFMNSMFVAVATVLLTLSVSVTAAYAFARFQFPGRKIMILTMLLVYMLPSIVLLVPLL